MSSFLTPNKAQTSQICEGDKYPTIGAVLTAISMCISFMRPTTACSVVKDVSTVTSTNSSLTPTDSRVSGGISILSRVQQVNFSPSSCWGHFVWRLIVVVCCAGSYLLCRPYRQLQVVNHHRYRKLTKQGWKCNSCYPEQWCKERGWIRHHARCWRPGLVEGRRTSSFSSHCCHDSSIPGYSCGYATVERVFSFTGLTFSDLRKSLLEGTLEVIMWAKWGSPSIPLGRGDLCMTHPELCD